MIVYHGSNSRFENLRISKDLVRSEASSRNEGLGIYFSIYEDVARSYGKYLYTLEINDNYVLDFRKKAVCKKYIMGIRSDIKKNIGVDICRYFDIDSLVEYIYCGNIAVSSICREIYLLLDSNENWYMEVLEDKMDLVYKNLENYDRKHLNCYLFNYNIKGIGIIKNVKPEIVKIINREKISS